MCCYLSVAVQGYSHVLKSKGPIFIRPFFPGKSEGAKSTFYIDVAKKVEGLEVLFTLIWPKKWGTLAHPSS